jgi:hypothetical protein
LISPWSELPRSSFPTGDLLITEPAVLYRLLPHQRDLEILFRIAPPAAANGQRACGSFFTFAYGSSFLDANRAAIFQDQSNPGRNRFLLQESDLPGQP